MKEDRMRIRIINKSDDRKAISRIYEESWKYAYSGIVPQDYLDSIPEGQWAEKIDTPDWHTMVCVENDELVGTCSFGKSRFEKYGDVGEIISVYFLPEHMRKGYGTALLMRVMETLKKKGYKEIFLWVLEDNKRARQFYESLGFVCTGDYRSDSIGGKKLSEVRYIYRFVNYLDYDIDGNKFRVFYIYDYVPKNRESLKKCEYDLEIQDKILRYKGAGNRVSRVVLEMTGVLHNALNEISNRNTERIVDYRKFLIAVPKSKFKGQSTIAKSIDLICQKDPTFIDKHNLLYREDELAKPQHEGHYRYYELESSLKCLYDGMDKYDNSTFFLIDDIASSGNTMLSCIRNLQNHGISKKRICCVVLAKTRSKYDQL